MAAVEQVIRAPAQLGMLLRGARLEQGMNQQELALKPGGMSQARLSQLELQPGRLTVERLLLLLAALNLEVVEWPRESTIETARVHCARSSCARAQRPSASNTATCGQHCQSRRTSARVSAVRPRPGPQASASA